MTEVVNGVRRRFVVVDHHTGDVYLLALHESGNAARRADARSWLDATAQIASAAARMQQSAQPAANGCSATEHSHSARDASCRFNKDAGTKSRADGTKYCFRARQSRAQYVQDVRSCLKVCHTPHESRLYPQWRFQAGHLAQQVYSTRQALYDGESYELCLTTALTAKQHVQALDLYRTLRRMNPAPYAAWLSFSDEVQVKSLKAIHGSRAYNTSKPVFDSV